jgi:hypothetical protein
MCIRFVKNVATTIPDEQMGKIKVVHLQKLLNFVVEPFFIWVTFVEVKYVSIFEILKFWIFQMDSNGETLNMKVVDPKKLWNFVVYKFFISNHIVNEIQIWISQIWNSNFVVDLKWKNSQHESCRSQKVMIFYSWQVFYLNPFSAKKTDLHSV